MTTINLYQNQQEIQEKLAARSASSGFIFSIGILIVTIMVWGGLKVAVSILDKKNFELASNVEQERINLASFGNIENIVDLQIRLEQIKNNLQIKDNAVNRKQATSILDHLGSDISSGIVVSEYKYDNDSNKVTLMLSANNFTDASRQILNLKTSNYFSNVNLIGISRGVKAIAASVEMSVK